jgi:hypothetical protein
MKSWQVNAVRIPLNEHCWLGVDDGAATPQYIGETYRQTVEKFVDLLIANNVYVILDLHWSAPAGQKADGQQAMPNSSYSVDFWKSVASRFQGKPQVMFDLFNEPITNNNVSDSTDSAAYRTWHCWRDGAAAGDSCDPDQNGGSSSTDLKASQVVGMQALVDAVRAAPPLGAGATNVVVLSGIKWANTIWSSPTNSWLTWKPTDPLNNLMASFHVYPFTNCTDLVCFDVEVAPVAAQVPVIAGEFGSNGCNDGSAERATWMNTLLDWLDVHAAGYSAWVWHTACGSKALIVDYTGNPSSSGKIFKDHLAALTDLAIPTPTPTPAPSSTPTPAPSSTPTPSPSTAPTPTPTPTTTATPYDMTASVTPTSVATGGSVTVRAVVTRTSSTAGTALIDIEIFSPSGARSTRHGSTTKALPRVNSAPTP